VNDAVLITGCYRSGTTLAEKLVNSHPQAVVGSQPFPVLYFAAKQEFLEERGVEYRYPLGHLFGETQYSPADLADFLENHVFGQEFVENLFNALESYTEGLWTPEILAFRRRLQPGTFLDLFSQLLGFVAEVFPKDTAAMIGAKEVLVEEIAEFLGQRGVRIVYVIRDPRDMISSLNFRARDNLTGENRPVLFSIRAWRKSVALAFQAHALGYGAVVRYEDLALDPVETMAEVTDFLGLPPLPGATFQRPILDQRGKSWGGNSSFEDKQGVSAGSIGTFRKRVPESVIRYVESCCFPEMRLLGYEPELIEAFDTRALQSFRSPFSSIHKKFPQDYSSDPARITQEIRRYELITGADEIRAVEDVRRWFLRSAAYERLRAACCGPSAGGPRPCARP